MIVRMLTKEAGPNGNWSPGQLRPMPRIAGLQYIELRYAELVEDDAPASGDSPEAEPTTIEDGDPLEEVDNADTDEGIQVELVGNVSRRRSRRPPR